MAAGEGRDRAGRGDGARSYALSVIRPSTEDTERFAHGYGVGVFGGRLVGTPEIGFGLSQSERELRLGWRLGLARSEGNVSLDLEVEATRRESVNDDREPEHGVGLRLSVRW